MALAWGLLIYPYKPDASVIIALTKLHDSRSWHMLLVRPPTAYPLYVFVCSFMFFVVVVVKKLFDPNGLPLPHLTYVGHTLLAGAASSEVIAEEAVRLSGLPPSTPIDLYEQVRTAVVLMAWVELARFSLLMSLFEFCA